jgi:hypothetical protein
MRASTSTRSIGFNSNGCKEEEEYTVLYKYIHVLVLEYSTTIVLSTVLSIVQDKYSTRVVFSHFSHSTTSACNWQVKMVVTVSDGIFNLCTLLILVHITSTVRIIK